MTLTLDDVRTAIDSAVAAMEEVAHAVEEAEREAEEAIQEAEEQVERLDWLAGGSAERVLENIGDLVSHAGYARMVETDEDLSGALWRIFVDHHVPVDGITLDTEDTDRERLDAALRREQSLNAAIAKARPACMGDGLRYPTAEDEIAAWGATIREIEAILSEQHGDDDVTSLESLRLPDRVRRLLSRPGLPAKTPEEQAIEAADDEVIRRWRRALIDQRLPGDPLDLPPHLARDLEYVVSRNGYRNCAHALRERASAYLDVAEIAATIAGRVPGGIVSVAGDRWAICVDAFEYVGLSEGEARHILWLAGWRPIQAADEDTSGVLTLVIEPVAHASAAIVAEE